VAPRRCRGSIERILCEIPKPGVAELRIRIFLDYIERKVVSPRETPDGDRQQQRDFDRRMLEKDRGGSEGAGGEEQGGFEVEQLWVLDGHAGFSA
jgi:hypothetical protein